MDLEHTTLINIHSNYICGDKLYSYKSCSLWISYIYICVCVCNSESSNENVTSQSTQRMEVAIKVWKFRQGGDRSFCHSVTCFFFVVNSARSAIVWHMNLWCIKAINVFLISHVFHFPSTVASRTYIWNVLYELFRANIFEKNIWTPMCFLLHNYT